MKTEISKEVSRKTGEEKELFIYVRSTDQKVPVSREVYEAYYGETFRTRKKEEYYGRCFCPKSQVWKCDGDCLVCPYRREGNELSLNVPGTEEEDEEWGDSFVDTATETEEAMEAKLMLKEVAAKLRELDPEADRMLAIWNSEENISDREMARRLDRKWTTFRDQMLRYRVELKNFF